MEDLTAFQRDLLVILTGMDAPYGLAIKAELEEYYSGDINHGRLYPNLDKLVEEGLLEKGELDKRTNYYELTERGQSLVDERQAWVGDHLADVKT